MEVTRGGRKTKVDPRKLLLLFLEEKYYESVVRYLKENKLDKKFRAYNADIKIQFKDEIELDTKNDSIKSIMLEMRSDEVLFEFKLSGKTESLVEGIRAYVYSNDEE